MKVKIVFLAGFISYCSIALSQSDSTLKEFKMDLEFRPRTEYRNGYRTLPNDTTHPAFFTSQRTRITLNYNLNKKFIFNTSIQDIRFWGEDDPRSTDGTLQIFEAYVEPRLNEYFSVRIGKQRVMLDNERLFAQNDWRQNSGTHDAARLMYQQKKVSGDLIAAFNQKEERIFETYFTPSFATYKSLLINHFKIQLDSLLYLTTIHATEGFQDTKDLQHTFYRNTSGGRIEWTHKKIYLTYSGYYQYGQTSTGVSLSAYYFQPEIRYNINSKTKFYLGAEIFSGDDALNPSSTSHSFDALYGVAHRFLGTMDYFLRFPKDFNNAGIIDPYLFLFYDITKNLTIKSDFHLFYSQNNFIVNSEVINKYLAFENDILFIYKPNNYTKIDLGFSWLEAEKSLEYIKKEGDSNKIAQWAYLQITFKPELFKWRSTK